jgi:ADP-ribose pyrophosphatase
MIEKETLIFQGRVIRLNVEQVRLPNNRLAELEIIHHPGGAAIVALDTQQRICLLYQYRHAAGGWVWELPAGKIDHREPPLQTAQRELEEESGCRASTWNYLGEYISSPGVFTEVIHLYLATDLETCNNQPEEHEVFQINWLPFEEALAMAHRGEIKDGKTLVGLFKTMQKLHSKPKHASSNSPI